MLYDAHCHPAEVPSKLGEIPAMDATLCVMSTRPDDIEHVKECSKFPNVIVAFGLHPWWSYLLSAGGSKVDHYQRVFTPAPELEEIESLPEPMSMDSYLNYIKQLLVNEPTALVGEVGLDKAFRVRINERLSRFRVQISHQKLVLERQLAMAQELNRPVSLHGVQAPGPLFDSVRQFSLPAVCLHSYSGSTEFYTQQWSKLTFPVYVSGAVIVNMPNQDKAESLLKGVPEHLVLSESDYGEAGEKMMHLLQQSQTMIANIYGWGHEEANERLGDNFWAFVRRPQQPPLPQTQFR